MSMYLKMGSDVKFLYDITGTVELFCFIFKTCFMNQNLIKII